MILLEINEVNKPKKQKKKNVALVMWPYLELQASDVHNSSLFISQFQQLFPGTDCRDHSFSTIANVANN